MDKINNYLINTNYGRFYLLDIINDIKNILKNNFLNKINNVYLFGSYARGDFNENSDIDFFIIYNNNNNDNDNSNNSNNNNFISICNKNFESKLSNIELDLLFKYGIEINFITENDKDFNDQLNYFLIKNLKKDGIEIWN